MTAHIDSLRRAQVLPAGALPHKLIALLMLCVVLAFALAGCADQRGKEIAYDPGHFNAPDPIAAVAAENAYKVGPGDTVAVAVMRVPDLSGDATIDPSGDITMPLIGKVAAIGKTTDQLARDISERLSAKYLQNPEVRVALKGSSSQHFTVDGAINAPGIYPITGSTTLLQAVALAKGTSQDANARKIAVFRTISGQRQAAAFDLSDIRRGKAKDPEIFGNDIIVVDSSLTKSRFKTLLSTIPLATLFRPF